MRKRLFVRFLAGVLLVLACGGAFCEGTGTVVAPPALDVLNAGIARFAPVEITAPVKSLSRKDRQALEKIIAAARIMDPLFLRQVWAGNEALLAKLEKDRTPLGKAELQYFRINVGPWSRLDRNAPFLAYVPPVRPPTANFYPEDLTRGEFEDWVNGLLPSGKEKATGFFHLVRRRGGPGANSRELVLVPYSSAYREFLEPAARLLREAAELTTSASLKRFLCLRADAFLSDDYFESDEAWMALDSPLDVTIGPYETYEDDFLSYKAAFEAFVTIRDAAGSALVAKYASQLQDLENHLPIDPKYRNPKIGSLAPITIVDEVFCSGNANAGVQTSAFNLPNDLRVIREKGSKRVMLRNVQECKFRKILAPVANLMLSPEARTNVTFEAFFTHILMHELSHGIGPNKIVVGGRDTSTRQELKDLYPAIDEARADITGLFAVQYLIDKGVVGKEMERCMYATFLATAFRAVRYGVNEPHSRGFIMIFNTLLDRGAVVEDPVGGTFSLDIPKMRAAAKDLCSRLLTLQAEGDYLGAKALLDKLGVLRPSMYKALTRLEAVPVDIRPIFPQAE